MDIVSSDKTLLKVDENKTGRYIVEETVKRIGMEAFSSPKLKIEEICIPSTTQFIEFRAFIHSKAEKILLSPHSTFKTIEREAFSYTTKLEEITLPDSIEDIKDSAFKYSNINKINIPKNLKHIRKDAFTFTKLKNVELPETLVSLGYYSFSQIKSLETVIFPSTLKKIPAYCFFDCPNLKFDEIKLPSSLEIIEDFAFGTILNKRLDNPEIYIPISVTKIGKQAFPTGSKLHITKRQLELNPHLKNEYELDTTFSNRLDDILIDRQKVSLNQLNDLLVYER